MLGPRGHRSRRVRWRQLALLSCVVTTCDVFLLVGAVFAGNRWVALHSSALLGFLVDREGSALTAAVVEVLPPLCSHSCPSPYLMRAGRTLCTRTVGLRGP